MKEVYISRSLNKNKNLKDLARVIKAGPTEIELLFQDKLDNL
jgi:hypothetical protein